METLAILLTLFLGIYVCVLVTLIIIDTIKTNKQIEATNESIKQLTERLENEKRKFYKYNNFVLEIKNRKYIKKM